MSAESAGWTRTSEEPGPPRRACFACGDEAFTEICQQMGIDTVEGAFEQGGGDELDKPGLGHRQRIRLRRPAGQGGEAPGWVYLKRYHREPLKLALRRRWTYGEPLSPARAEARAVRDLAAAGVPAIDQAFGGEEYDSRGRVARSFVVLDEVPGESLERIAEPWLAGDAGRGKQLAERLGELIGRLHACGRVHRDLYACHVFLHETEAGIELRLIDLARVFRPRWRPFRWRVKDLAQMKFSMPPDWVARHWAELMASYLRACPGGSRERYNRAVAGKVARLEAQARRRRRRRGAAEQKEST